MDLPDRTTATAAVVAVATDDTWTHVYSTFDQLLDHNDDTEAPLGAVEFFDATGRRLAIVFDPAWGLAGLQPTAEIPDRNRLRERLQAVIRHLANYVRGHPEVVATLPDPPDDIDKWLRALAESDLHNIINTIEAQTSAGGGGVQPLDTGGWLHNLAHAAGWSH